MFSQITLALPSRLDFVCSAMAGVKPAAEHLFGFSQLLTLSSHKTSWMLLPQQPTRTEQEILTLLSVFGLLTAVQCRGICKQGKSATLCTQNISQPATPCKGRAPICLTLHTSIHFCLLPQDFHPRWTFKHIVC